MEVNDSEKTKHVEKTAAQQSENPWENHYQFFAEFSSSSETFSVEDFSRVLRKSGHCMYPQQHPSEYLQLQCELDALQTAKLQWRRWGRGGLLCTFWKKKTEKSKKNKLESSKWAQKNTLNSQKQFPSQLDYEKKVQNPTSWKNELSWKTFNIRWMNSKHIGEKGATLRSCKSCCNSHWQHLVHVRVWARCRDRFTVEWFAEIPCALWQHHMHPCTCMHEHMAKLWNIRQNFFKRRKHVGKTLSGKEWWKVVQFPLR